MMYLLFNLVRNTDHNNKEQSFINNQRKVNKFYMDLNDLKCVYYDSDGFGFFTSVSKVELKWADKNFNNESAFLIFLVWYLSVRCSQSSEIFNFDVSIWRLENNLGYSRNFLGDCFWPMISYWVLVTGFELWLFEYLI